VKSVSCKGVRVQVVLPQAARSCSVSPGSINTLQSIFRFHLCVAEWVPGQLSMGPTLFRPVRLSSEECVLQGGEGASCAATGCQELLSQPWQHKYIAKYNSFPFMCGRVGAWAAEHGSNPVQTCQVVQ